MVDLSKFVGKEVTATLRSGESPTGTVKNSERNKCYPYQFLGNWYTEDGDWDVDSEDKHDIISIKLPEKAPMSNKVDLSKYVGKEIKVILRSGESRESLVGLNEDSSEWYPYTFWGDTYTKDGHWFADVESMRDIISISCEDDPQPEPAKAIHIAWLDNQFICALPSKQEVKDYIKLKHPDVDPFDVVILTEALKSEP